MGKICAIDVNTGCWALGNDRVQVFLADGSEVWLNVHDVFVEWDGRRRHVKADATGKLPMVGMSLLHRHNLYMEVVEGGQVTVETQV